MKQERRIRKKDKEVQRERWKEIEKEMEGKRLTSRKNLIFFPTRLGVRGGEGGGAGCSLQNYLPSQFLSQFSAQPKCIC